MLFIEVGTVLTLCQIRNIVLPACGSTYRPVLQHVGWLPRLGFCRHLLVLGLAQSLRTKKNLHHRSGTASGVAIDYRYTRLCSQLREQTVDQLGSGSTDVNLEFRLRLLAWTSLLRHSL